MSSLPWRNWFLSKALKTYAKSTYLNFLVLSNFTWFSFFWQNILSPIINASLWKWEAVLDGGILNSDINRRSMLSRSLSYYLAWEASYSQSHKNIFSQFCDWFQISIFIAKNVQNVSRSWLISFVECSQFSKTVRCKYSLTSRYWMYKTTSFHD